MSLLSSLLSAPPPPTFTPSSLIDLSSKVYIITSVSSLTPGTLHLAKILYTLHATVYIGCYTHTHYTTISSSIQKSCPASKGVLKPFLFDPADLCSIKVAAETLLEDEWRLDVLLLSSDKLPPSFLIAQLLLPRMMNTASHFCHPNPSIRMIWISSSTSSPHIPNAPSTLSIMNITYLIAHEFANRPHTQELENVDPHAHTLPDSNPSGVQHVVVDSTMPGSNLQRSMGRLLLTGSKDDEYAACTLLYAGLAPEVRSGDLVVPWGRKGVVSAHVEACTVAKESEEKSVSARLYEWYKEEVRQLMYR
jgi:retinol dehydrogenase-12